MTGIPITGTLVPDGSFPVVDVAHVHDAEVAGTAATAVAAIPDATTAVRGMATPTQVQRIELLTRTFESFGAAGDCNPATGSGIDDTAAIQAALTWCNGVGKAVTGSPGKVYKVTASLNTWRTFILGSIGGDNDAWAFYRPAGTSGAFLITGGLEPVVARGVITYGGYGACQYSTIAGFTVLGPTGCGEDCILAPFNFLNNKVNIHCFGGFTRNTLRCHRDAPGSADWVDGYVERQGGYIIYCDITIDTLPGKWAGQGLAANGVHVRGYSLASRYSGNCQAQHTFYYFSSADPDESAPAFASNVTITGCIEAGTYAVHMIGGHADVTALHCEAVTATLQLEGASGTVGRATEASSLQESDGYFQIGGILPSRWDHACKIPVIIGRPLLLHDLVRDSMNELMLCAVYNAGKSTYSPGTFGAIDPQNQVLNGDFSRWVGADGTDSNIAGLVGHATGYAYRGTKCGVGCPDTTRTLSAPNCALLEPSTGNEQGVWGNFRVKGLVLQQYHLGCYLFATFKAKTVDPTAVITSGISFDEGGSRMGADRAPVAADWRFDAENGFELYTFAFLVSQDHIDHTPLVLLFCTNGAASNACYVSEVQCSLGYSCARAFNRASVHTPTESRLQESGRLEFPVDSIPVASTDPVFGQAFISGDRALLRVPTTTGSLMLTGWEYSGSTWVPQYVLTSAAILAAGYTDLLGTFDSSTATADLTYEAYRDTPMRMPWLHRSQDDAISLHYQMPHNWTLTAVEPHVHIIQGAATGGDLVLDGRLAWSRSGITNLPAWASWTPFRVKTTLSATQWTHTMISLGTFTPPAGALYPSASLHVWLRRPGVADSEDTYEGDKVGGPTAAANVGLEYADCHVQVQGFGTVTAT